MSYSVKFTTCKNSEGQLWGNGWRRGGGGAAIYPLHVMCEGMLYNISFNESMGYKYFHANIYLLPVTYIPIFSEIFLATSKKMPALLGAIMCGLILHYSTSMHLRHEPHISKKKYWNDSYVSMYHPLPHLSLKNESLPLLSMTRSVKWKYHSTWQEWSGGRGESQNINTTHQVGNKETKCSLNRKNMFEMFTPLVSHIGRSWFTWQAADT